MKFRCPVQRKIENSERSQIVLGHHLHLDYSLCSKCISNAFTFLERKSKIFLDI